MGKIAAIRKSKADNEKEDRIRQALAARENRDPLPTFRNLALEFGVARSQAYTKLNIKNVFRATGIYPFNPNAVLTRLPSIKSPASLSFLDDNSLSITNPVFRTPKTKCDLRYQTTAAIKLVSSKESSTKTDTIAFILLLAHLAEASYLRAEIENIETEKLRATFAGRKAAKTDRRVLSKARIITGADVVRLKKEREDREALAYERKRARTQRASAKGVTEAKGQRKAGRKQVHFAFEEEEEREAYRDEEYETEAESLSDDAAVFVTPQTGRTRYPILSPILSTPSNPNRRLPDRALSMQLRTRRHQSGFFTGREYRSPPNYSYKYARVQLQDTLPRGGSQKWKPKAGNHKPGPKIGNQSPYHSNRT
ncbi:hypothetical protein HOY82DRAFT_588848 [Tuber indicum]|nr:hypothetical protein HOY82DRAFT_588848 [Tuber indicum]